MNKKYNGFLKAKTPISHGGNIKTGSQTMLRRIKYYVDGKFIEIPYISGNALRGRLRRMSFLDLFQLIGFKMENLKLHHVLFSGGTLESVNSKDVGTIDFELRREIRDTLPMLSLLGTAIGNQIMAGKLIVGNIVPICKELNPIFGTEETHSIFEFLDQSFQTRKDDLHLEKTKDETATQMLYEFEVFVPGTVFSHSFTLEDPTDLEVSAFGRMMELFKKSPYIGAMKATGMAEFEVLYPNLPSSELYVSFVKDNKDKIVAVLRDLEKRV